MNPNIVLYGAGLISLDTAVAASITPSSTCWRRCAVAAVFSWVCVAAFVAVSVMLPSWCDFLAGVFPLLAAVHNTRDAVNERRRYLTEKAAHERAIDEVVRVLKSLPSGGSA